MKDDEYDLLIDDPSNYWQRFYVPRMFGALEPWSMLPPFTDLCEMPVHGAVLRALLAAAGQGRCCRR